MARSLSRGRPPDRGGRFLDRREAGRLLAERVAELPVLRRDGLPLVLAVPRGGVVVGAEVARRLDAPLDLVVAHKLGAPGQPELAIGAIVCPGDIRVLDDRAIGILRVPASYLEDETNRQLIEANRRLEFLRGDLPAPAVRGRQVILVDDGIATGSTLRAAIEAIRRQEPAAVVVAVPVAPLQALESLEGVVDEIACVLAPDPFYAVGNWYSDFDQVSDEEVWHLLRSNPANCRYKETA